MKRRVRTTRTVRTTISVVTPKFKGSASYKRKKAFIEISFLLENSVGLRPIAGRQKKTKIDLGLALQMN